MHQVADARVQASGRSQQGGWMISALSLRCPTCGERQHVNFDEPLNNNSVHAEPRSTTCQGPECRKPLYLYVTEPPQRDELGWLWLHPDPDAIDRPDPEIERLLSGVSPVLSSAYEQAVSTLRHGAADASAGMSRKVLEGLVKHELRTAGTEIGERETLGTLLKKLGDDTSRLAAPLLQIAEAITWVANEAAHVDLDVEPPARYQSAAKLLTLVAQVATYLLDTPKQARALKDSLERDREEPPSTPPESDSA